MKKIYVIIVAAGSGSRFGTTVPKQFCNMNGRPVLMTTIDAFRNAVPQAEILLVLNRNMEAFWNDLCLTHMFYVKPRVIYGGETRTQSVRNALDAIDISPDEAADAVVLVHDGARPLVNLPTIRRVVQAVEQGGNTGVIPVINVTDSLREVGSGEKSKAVDRARFRAVQTPQGFSLDILRRAYTFADISQFTDDASVVEAAGYPPAILVEGSHDNIKITNPIDIQLAEVILRNRQ